MRNRVGNQEQKGENKERKKKENENKIEFDLDEEEDIVTVMGIPKKRVKPQNNDVIKHLHLLPFD